MGLALFMFMLALLVAIGYIVWAYRKKSAEKAAVRKQRYQEFFGTDVQSTRPDTGVQAPPAPASSPLTVSRTTVGVIYRRRERLLGAVETVLYYVLRSGLPDHVVFGCVSLSALLEAPGTLQNLEREQQTRNLSLHRVDFVICDKTSRIVAAVDLEDSGAGAAGSAKFKLDCLTAAGIRYVLVKSDAIPRREDVKALIFGAAD